MPVFSKKLQRSDSQAIIRPLTLDDRGSLEALISTDPVGFLYAAEHLHLFGLPTPSTLAALKTPRGFIGIFAPRALMPVEHTPKDALPALSAPAGESLPRRMRGMVQSALRKSSALGVSPAGFYQSDTPTLVGTGSVPGYAEMPAPTASGSSYVMVGALWLGANCVPLAVPEQYQKQTATYIYKHHRKIGSIFGHQAVVMGLWEHLAHRMPAPFDIRESQPLLELPSGFGLEELALRPLNRDQLSVPQITDGVRWARTSDRQSLLQASVAMFTEEVGYDPMGSDPAGYARRIDELTRTGRTLVAVNAEGVVVFKTDVGLAHGDICQLQGVWLHPAYRGLGLAPTLLAQASELIRARFPRLSLYVNDYNTVARALYRRTGWQHVDTFASILL
ncbi:MAG: GNAT family N-acetyltransferase [Rothia sp. (in: high G+C Gram-positive bacteria)]|nr:GNAT family N-acetyltransferase [Rothia sp. (in: high G+C Gram-positive bacteria)]